MRPSGPPSDRPRAKPGPRPTRNTEGEERPKREPRGDRRPDARGEQRGQRRGGAGSYSGKPGGRSGGRSGGKFGGKPGERAGSDRPRSDRPRSDRPRNDRPREDRGERSRSGPRSGARYVSHALLFHVLKENVTLDEAIERSRAFAQLEDRDRRFVRQLVATTLRRLGQIQNILRDYLADPLPPKNFNVKVLLLMGIAEHHFMRTPSHALVSEAVSLARSDDTMRGYQGLANAVLRKVCDREKDDLPHPRYNLPRWMAKRWHTVYGDAWLTELSDALTQAPPTDLAVKPGVSLPIEAPSLDEEPSAPSRDETSAPSRDEPPMERLAPTVIKGEILGNGALRLAPAQGSIAQLPGYEAGDWWVQDAAAQVPVLMLGDVAGKRVLDLCAAPGGKTLQLAAQGAKVTAVDISENRLKRLYENLERCHLDAEVVAQDALTYDSEERFDAILLDAPCSATGTLRRHPELLWQRREDSLLTNRRLQAKLLGRAARLLKPDGVLVYAVCSLEPEEGIDQIKAAVAALPLAVSPMPATPDWLSPLLTTEGFFRSAPQNWADKGGMDGFFAARLQRREKEKPKAASTPTPRAGRLRLGAN